MTADKMTCTRWAILHDGEGVNAIDLGSIFTTKRHAREWADRDDEIVKVKLTIERVEKVQGK